MDNNYYLRRDVWERKNCEDDKYSLSDHSDSKMSAETDEQVIKKKFDDIRNTSSSSSSSASESDCDSSTSSDYEYEWQEAKPAKPSVSSSPATVNVGGSSLPAIKREFYSIIPLKSVMVILFPNNTPEDLDKGVSELEIHELTEEEAKLLTNYLQSRRKSGIRSITVGDEIYVSEFHAGDRACTFSSLRGKYDAILDDLFLSTRSLNISDAKRKKQVIRSLSTSRRHCNGKSSSSVETKSFIKPHVALKKQASKKEIVAKQVTEKIINKDEKRSIDSETVSSKSIGLSASATALISSNIGSEVPCSQEESVSRQRKRSKESEVNGDERTVSSTSRSLESCSNQDFQSDEHSMDSWTSMVSSELLASKKYASPAEKVLRFDAALDNKVDENNSVKDGPQGMPVSTSVPSEPPEASAVILSQCERNVIIVREEYQTSLPIPVADKDEVAVKSNLVVPEDFRNLSPRITLSVSKPRRVSNATDGAFTDEDRVSRKIHLKSVLGHTSATGNGRSNSKTAVHAALPVLENPNRSRHASVARPSAAALQRKQQNKIILRSQKCLISRERKKRLDEADKTMSTTKYASGSGSKDRRQSDPGRRPSHRSKSPQTRPRDHTSKRSRSPASHPRDRARGEDGRHSREGKSRTPSSTDSRSRHSHRESQKEKRCSSKDSVENCRRENDRRHDAHHNNYPRHRENEYFCRRVTRKSFHVPDYSKLKYTYSADLYSSLSSSEADFGDDEEAGCETLKRRVFHTKSTLDEVRHRSRQTNQANDFIEINEQPNCRQISDGGNFYEIPRKIKSELTAQAAGKARLWREMRVKNPNISLYEFERIYDSQHPVNMKSVQLTAECPQRAPDGFDRKLGAEKMESVVPALSDDIEQLVVSIRRDCDKRQVAQPDLPSPGRWIQTDIPKRSKSTNHRSSYRSHKKSSSKIWRSCRERRRSHSPSCARSFTPPTRDTHGTKRSRRRSLSPVYHKVGTGWEKNWRERRGEPKPYVSRSHLNIQERSRSREYITKDTLNRDSGSKTNDSTRSLKIFTSINQQLPTIIPAVVAPQNADNAKRSRAFIEFERIWADSNAGSSHPNFQTTHCTADTYQSIGDTGCRQVRNDMLSASNISSQTMLYGYNSPFKSVEHMNIKCGQQMLGAGFCFGDDDASNRLGNGPFIPNTVKSCSALDEEQVIILKEGGQRNESEKDDLWPFGLDSSTCESSNDDSCDDEVESFMFSRLSHILKNKKNIDDANKQRVVTDEASQGRTAASPLCASNADKRDINCDNAYVNTSVQPLACELPKQEVKAYGKSESSSSRAVTENTHEVSRGAVWCNPANEDKPERLIPGNENHTIRDSSAHFSCSLGATTSESIRTCAVYPQSTNEKHAEEQYEQKKSNITQLSTEISQTDLINPKNVCEVVERVTFSANAPKEQAGETQGSEDKQDLGNGQLLPTGNAESSTESVSKVNRIDYANASSPICCNAVALMPAESAKSTASFKDPRSWKKMLLYKAQSNPNLPLDNEMSPVTSSARHLPNETTHTPVEEDDETTLPAAKESDKNTISNNVTAVEMSGQRVMSATSVTSIQTNKLSEDVQGVFDDGNLSVKVTVPSSAVIAGTGIATAATTTNIYGTFSSNTMSKAQYTTVRNSQSSTISSDRIFSNAKPASAITILTNSVQYEKSQVPRTCATLASRSTFRGPQARNIPKLENPLAIQNANKICTLDLRIPCSTSSSQQTFSQIVAAKVSSTSNMVSTSNVVKPVFSNCSEISTTAATVADEVGFQSEIPPFTISPAGHWQAQLTPWPSVPYLSRKHNLQPHNVPTTKAKSGSDDSEDIGDALDSNPNPGFKIRPQSAVKLSRYCENPRSPEAVSKSSMTANPCSHNPDSKRSASSIGQTDSDVALSCVVSPKPLKSILHNPIPTPTTTINASLLLNPMNRDDSRDFSTLPQSPVPFSTTVITSSDLAEAISSIDDSINKQKRRPGPKIGSKKRKLPNQSGTSRGRPAKRSSGGKGRKKRKRLPSLSSDEDLIEELNATTAQPDSKETVSKLVVQDNVYSDSEEDDSDDGLVSFIDIKDADKHDTKEASLDEMETDEDSDDSEMDQKYIKEEYHQADRASGEKEDAILEALSYSSETSDQRSEQTLQPRGAEEKDSDEENIFTKMSKEMKAVNDTMSDNSNYESKIDIKNIMSVYSEERTGVTDESTMSESAEGKCRTPCPETITRTSGCLRETAALTEMKNCVENSPVIIMHPDNFLATTSLSSPANPGVVTRNEYESSSEQVQPLLPTPPSSPNTIQRQTNTVSKAATADIPAKQEPVVPIPKRDALDIEDTETHFDQKSTVQPAHCQPSQCRAGAVAATSTSGAADFWLMPEGDSCHGFLEVCMTVQENKVYSLRRIPYVKTTSKNKDSNMTSSPLPQFNGTIGYSCDAHSNSNNTNNDLPMSSACATYLRLRDVIALLKLQPEVLCSLMTRCGVKLSKANEYTRKLYSTVYDPVCQSDATLNRMTMGNKPTHIQSFLEKMLILDEFLNNVLPKFYLEALEIQSFDVPKYVNVKIFKPISNIDEGVVEIFRKPYEYNVVLRRKDDKVKCNTLKRKRLTLGGENKSRKQAKRTENKAVKQTRKVSAEPSSSQTPAPASPNSYATRRPYPRLDVHPRGLDIMPRDPNYIAACRVSAAFPACFSNAATVPPVQPFESSGYVVASNSLGAVLPANAVSRYPFPSTALNLTMNHIMPDYIGQLVSQPAQYVANTTRSTVIQCTGAAIDSASQFNPGPVNFSSTTSSYHLQREMLGQNSFPDTAVNFANHVDLDRPTTATNTLHVSPENVTAGKTKEDLLTKASSPSEFDFTITSVFSLKKESPKNGANDNIDQYSDITENSSDSDNIEPVVTSSSLLTTKEFLMNASKVMIGKNRVEKSEDRAGKMYYEESSESQSVWNHKGITMDPQKRAKLVEKLLPIPEGEPCHLSGVVSKLQSRVKAPVPKSPKRRGRKRGAGGVKKKGKTTPKKILVEHSCEMDKN